MFAITLYHMFSLVDIVNFEVICLLYYYPLSHVLIGWYCIKSTKLIFKCFVHMIISSRPIKFNILNNSTMFRCQLQIDKDIYICIYSKFKLNNFEYLHFSNEEKLFLLFFFSSHEPEAELSFSDGKVCGVCLFLTLITGRKKTEITIRYIYNTFVLFQMYVN